MPQYAIAVSYTHLQVPALVMGGLTVVVSPLISLMKDQVDQLLANGVAAACLNSTQSREQQQDVMAGCRSGQVRLLYIAPERLDVYKRQYESNYLLYTWTSDLNKEAIRSYDSVSYTHLDVYKRQALW